MSVATAKPKNSFRKIIFIALAVLLIVGAALGGLAWYAVFGPNTKTPPGGTYLYIPTGATFSTVMDSLDKHDVLKNRSSFTQLAEKKAYTNKVKAGRYHITHGMSNNKLINMLRSGRQSPVMVTFNSIRTLKQLAGRLSRQLEPDSISLFHYMSDKKNASTYGFTSDNVLLMFIPNTYEFFWNTSAEDLFERMNQEYLRFWNEARKESAASLGLSTREVGILASIVEMETVKADERPVVAGVYINRLQRGIPLEADPTVIFAIGDFSIRRVLNKHLAYPSPYNTYLNKGLPPGPIAMPSVSSLEAVLKYKKHNYIFFCARPDLSGYHSFATNLKDHMDNARAYQRALDKMNIKN